MAKQAIGLGSTANDGTGDSLRVGGDKINDNFDEIYTTYGDGSTLTPFTTGTSTLTNKTFNLTNNTLTGTIAEFNTALSDGDFATLSGTETLSNKTLTAVGGTVSRTGDLLFDVSGDIFLDVGGKDIIFRYDGIQFGLFTFHSGGNLLIQSGTTTNLTMTGANSAFAGNVDVGGNITVTGNLSVNGTTTTVATTNTTLSDNMFELNSGVSSNANDIGIIMERGSTGDNAIFAWDESEDKFTIGTTTATADSTGNISITAGTLVANTFEGNVTGDVTGNVTGNLTGNVTGNVTGTLTGNVVGGVAASATTLETARTIGMTGDVVWTSAAFDGTANVSGTATIQAASIERAMVEDGAINSSKLASAVTLQILDSSGSTVKTIIGAGS